MHIASSGKRGNKRGLNFELNLVPFIDVLSTCICFLLVTAVFVHLGSFHVSQAVGSEKSKQDDKPKGTVTASLGDRGDIRFSVKDVPGLSGSAAETTISGMDGKVNFQRTQDWIVSFSSQHHDVKTVLIMPNPSSKYDDLVQLMAQFKKASLDQIGIAPL